MEQIQENDFFESAFYLDCPHFYIKKMKRGFKCMVCDYQIKCVV